MKWKTPVKKTPVKTEETCQKVEQKIHKDGNFNKKLKLQDQSRKYWAYHQEQIEKAEGGN